MSELIAVQPDPLLERLASLDREVDHAESDGIMARWFFGRELLARRISKQLPNGLLDDLVAKTGKSRQELQFRVQFADRFPDEDEVSNGVRHFNSWHRIVNEALASTAHLSSEKDEWSTPDDLFDLLNAEFQFTLDVCAGNGNAKVAHHFTKADSGLLKSWQGEVAFMNPPYSEVYEWMQKACDEGAENAIVVCLVPARTDVGWFWEFAQVGEVRFLKGRVHFIDDEGNTGPAPFPSCVIVFSPSIEPSMYCWDRELDCEIEKYPDSKDATAMPRQFYWDAAERYPEPYSTLRTRYKIPLRDPTDQEPLIYTNGAGPVIPTQRKLL